MAAGDSDQERTEAATPRRREDAKKEGRVPRSQELTTAAVLLGSALALNALGPALARWLLEAMRGMLILSGSAVLNGTSVAALLRALGWKTLVALSALTLAIVAAGGGVAAIQARGVLTWQPLQPKFERVNPVSNAKRILGIQGWADLLKSLLKLGIVGVIVWKTLHAAWGDSIGLAATTPFDLAVVLRAYVVKLLMTAGLCYLVFAGADYGYQVWTHEKQLRMTKQEVKEEAKQNEGDPMVKAQRRAFGRQMARRQMFKEVPRADVVVTNPTHIAVALKYDPALADAPVVVAMGQRKVAERIKAIAREHGVPTLENRPLARALLASARVGTAIPPELYMAVAEGLAWVISQRGRLRNVTA
jgi:flagellar biosynthetic protein FlhB